MPRRSTFEMHQLGAHHQGKGAQDNACRSIYLIHNPHVCKSVHKIFYEYIILTSEKGHNSRQATYNCGAKQLKIDNELKPGHVLAGAHAVLRRLVNPLPIGIRRGIVLNGQSPGQFGATIGAEVLAVLTGRPTGGTDWGHHYHLLFLYSDNV